MHPVILPFIEMVKYGFLYIVVRINRRYYRVVESSHNTYKQKSDTVKCPSSQKNADCILGKITILFVNDVMCCILQMCDIFVKVLVHQKLFQLWMAPG